MITLTFGWFSFGVSILLVFTGLGTWFGCAYLLVLDFRMRRDCARARALAAKAEGGKGVAHAGKNGG